MNNKWLKNSSFLKGKFAEFYEKAVSQDFGYKNLRITDIAEGNLLLESEQCRCFLHSTYSIEREMQELLQDGDDPEQILIIFGLGMGHCLDYIEEKRFKYKQVLVLEPFNNVFRELLKTRDLEKLLRKRNVSLSIFRDAREVMPQIMGQIMTSKKVKFVFHLSYRTVFAEIYQEISRIFSEEKIAFLANRATINYFLTEWTENQIKSIAKKQSGAALLYNKFKNVPAVIVAAGPSLEKHIDRLGEIQDRALIIAAGTGAWICSQKGIRTHMAMGMDSQKAEADLFQNSTFDILVGSYRLHPEVDRVVNKRILRTMLSNDFIAQYLHNYFDLPVETISDFASVASSAVHYAAKLGCSPIILVGQDLCYYDDRLHAYEEKGSLSPALKNQIQEQRDITRDINGELVYTHPGFLVIRRDMELLNLNYRDTNVIINASEAGLGIPGVENCTFKEAIDRYITPRDNDVGTLLEKNLGQSGAEDKYQSLDINAFYLHLLDEVERLEKINTEKLRLLEELQRLLEKGYKSNRLHSKLYFIQEKSGQMQESDFYVKVVMPILKSFYVYFQAGVFYNFSGEPDDPEAWLFYEGNVYELTSRYLAIIKEMVIRELQELSGRQPE